VEGGGFELSLRPVKRPQVRESSPTLQLLHDNAAPSFLLELVSTGRLQPHTPTLHSRWLSPEAAEGAAVVWERRQWRAELERVAADDPLDTWCKYVQWTEQHSTSVNAVELRSLLEEATQGLQAHARFPQYKRDQRYLTLWIKYVRGALALLSPMGLA